MDVKDPYFSMSGLCVAVDKNTVKNYHVRNHLKCVVYFLILPFSKRI